MSNCQISHKINEAANSKRSECGFMGKTHATSAVAASLAMLAFLPSITERYLGTNDIWLVILSIITVAGASLLPDLDNTSSTSRNSLGALGAIASEFIRGLSATIQMATSTKRDDPEPNPHRGAAHTIPAALMTGILVFLGTQIPGSVNIPYLGVASVGQLFAISTIFIMCHLALTGLVKPLMKKIGDASVFGEIGSFALSLAIVLLVAHQAPQTDYQWLGVGVAFGCLIHIIGDAFTTSGVPLLFPFTRKGKRWWMVRFTKIKAGGVTEKFLFVPIFVIISLVSLLKIFGVL